MADFGQAVAKVLQREGGATVTDHPADKGGVTKFGISESAYPGIDIRSLTEQQARDIYRRDFWDRICGQAIENQVIAEVIFDTAVNMGVRTASRLAQLAIGDTNADGIIGDKTIARLNRAQLEAFLASYTLIKIARYVNICNKDKSQSVFLLGWLNRTLGAV